MKKKTSTLVLALLLFAPGLSLRAAQTAVDCSKKTLTSEIAKLDKFVPNTLNISGNCTEDVVVSGFKDLTLIGVGAASITATGPAGTGAALLVNDNSRITVQTLTINGGDGAWCQERSNCVFRNVTIQGGGAGLVVTLQSGADILGSSVIRNSLGTGVGVWNQSAVFIRPDQWNFEEAGPVISGHSIGAQVYDGSFLRADNATFSGNGTGIDAAKNAVIKIYASDSRRSLGGVIDNAYNGILVRFSSSAGIGTLISGNGGAGILVGPLGLFHNQGVTFSGNNQDVVCSHTTAISHPPISCGH